MSTVPIDPTCTACTDGGPSVRHTCQPFEGFNAHDLDQMHEVERHRVVLRDALAEAEAALRRAIEAARCLRSKDVYDVEVEGESGVVLTLAIRNALLDVSAAQTRAPAPEGTP